MNVKIFESGVVKTFMMSFKVSRFYLISVFCYGQVVSQESCFPKSLQKLLKEPFQDGIIGMRNENILKPIKKTIFEKLNLKARSKFVNYWCAW